MNLSKEGNLNALADKDDYILKTVNGVQILDNDFPGLKDQRRIVQWLFSETTNILASISFTEIIPTTTSLLSFNLIPLTPEAFLPIGLVLLSSNLIAFPD